MKRLKLQRHSQDLLENHLALLWLKKLAPILYFRWHTSASEKQQVVWDMRYSTHSGTKIWQESWKVVLNLDATTIEQLEQKNKFVFWGKKQFKRGLPYQMCPPYDNISISANLSWLRRIRNLTVEVPLSISSVQVVTDNSNFTLSYESLDIFIYKDSIIEVF